MFYLYVIFSMNMSGGVYQSMNGVAVAHDTQNYPMQEHPRVVFISSRVPAADVSYKGRKWECKCWIQVQNLKFCIIFYFRIHV